MIDGVRSRSLLLMLGALVFAGFAADPAGDYIHFRLGVKHQEEKRYDQAIEEFRKVLSAYPDNYNAYMRLAEIRKVQGQPRLVIYNLKKALTYNPGWGKAHRMLAEAYVEDAQYPNAIIELQTYQQTCDPAERDSIQGEIDRLLKITEGTHKGARILSSLLADSGKTSGGQAPSAAINPAAQAAFEKGVRLYGEGKHQEALEQFRTCLSLQPGHAGAYYYAGMIRKNAGQSKMAKLNFLRSTSYSELGHEAHLHLGKIFAEEANYSEAVNHLTLYLKRSPSAAGKQEAQRLIDRYRPLVGTTESAKQKVDETKQDIETAPSTMEIRLDSILSLVLIDTLTDAGRALLTGARSFTQGKYDAAVREFKDAFVSRPTGQEAPFCLYNIGVCQMKLRLFEKAENQFQQVIDKYPTHPLAAKSLFLKALTYTERKDPTVAEKLFRSFIGTYRQHAWIGRAYERLGDAYVELEQRGKAIDSYQQAATLARSEADRVYALYKLGNSYLETSNSKRALESFQKAIDIGTRHSLYERVPDSYYRMADHQYQLKQYDSALTLYTRVTRAYPQFIETPWGLFQIGNASRQLKQYRKAIDTYKELIAKYPDDYWAKQARWKMEDAVWEYEYQAAAQ